MQSCALKKNFFLGVENLEFQGLTSPSGPSLSLSEVPGPRIKNSNLPILTYHWSLAPSISPFPEKRHYLPIIKHSQGRAKYLREVGDSTRRIIIPWGSSWVHNALYRQETKDGRDSFRGQRLLAAHSSGAWGELDLRS